jgi:P27 family predicted phage terminase small subunit
LKARGTFRPDRHAGRDLPSAAALVKLPPCPARLKGEARKLWKRLGNQLVGQGLLTALDLDVLADLCVLAARLLEAEQHLAGLALVGDDGKPSPWLKIVDTCQGQINRLRAQFGLGPANRLKVRPSPPAAQPEADPKLRFFEAPNRGDAG